MAETKQAPRIALITGAERGIGFETARQLAARGFHAVIGARGEAGEEAARKLRDGGGAASFLRLDISKSESVAAAAAEFGRRFGRLDVLVNNAGISIDGDATILTVTRQQASDTMQTNALGSLEVSQAFLPFLRKGKQARIVNVSSSFGQTEAMRAEFPAYRLSKMALNGITLMLHAALANEGIAVNAMGPGWVRTEMGGSGAARSVEEGADTVVWLAAEAPHGVSGKMFQDREVVPW